MSNHTTTGEWTADSVMMMFLSQDGGQGRASGAYKAIADAHEAALAAERDKSNVRETELICERDYFKKELAVERKKYAALTGSSNEVIEIDEKGKVHVPLNPEIQQLREQLAAAEQSYKAADQRSIEEQQQLAAAVEALIKIANDPHCDRCQIAVNALAKIGWK